MGRSSVKGSSYKESSSQRDNTRIREHIFHKGDLIWQTLRMQENISIEAH